MAKKSRVHPDEAVPGGPKGLRRRGVGPSYYFKRQHNSKRYSIALGASLAQARMKAQQIINAMERGDFRESDFKTSRTGIITALTEAMERLGRRKGHSKKSRASYVARIRHFATFLDEKHPRCHHLTDLTREHGEGYVEWRRAQLVTRSGKARPETPRNTPAPQTIHDDVRRLRTLFREIGDAAPINPFTNVSVPRKANDERSAPRSLTEAEVKRLLRAAREYDNAERRAGATSTFRGMMEDMIVFYLHTGLRKEELLYLPWAHVDLSWNDRGKIEIKPFDISLTLQIAPPSGLLKKLDRLAAKRSPRDRLFASVTQMQSCIPKNYADQEHDALMALRSVSWDAESERLSVPTRVTWRQKASAGSIPLTKDSRAVLLRRKTLCPAESPFVFPHPDLGPLRSDPLPQFKHLLRAAGLPNSIRIHDLRHTFGFTLRDKRVPLETIMGLMRHADIKETMLYAQYTLGEGAREIQTLDGFAH